MKNGNFFPAVVIIGAFVGVLFWVGGSRAPDKGTQTALKPTDNTYLGIRNHDDKPESTLELTSPAGEHWGLSLYAGGVPYQEREQAEANGKSDKPGWSYKWTVHRYPIDYDTDLGAWAGFRVSDSGKGDHNGVFDVGLRYSPVRFAYGVIAPDLLLSPRQAGVGVSFYPPAQSVSYNLQHLGVGVAYMADFDGGTGWCPYLSLSTRF